MPDRLPAFIACVDHQSEAFLVHILFFCNLTGLLKEMTEKFFLFNQRYVLSVFPWNNKDVRWRLRAYVSNGEEMFILVDQGSINVAFADFAKETARIKIVFVCVHL